MDRPQAIGSIGWIDLTVPDADGVRDFYREVVGWTASEVPMGDHSDYCMHPSADAPPVAGICHAPGEITDLPPQWLIYIHVADLDRSMARRVDLGGEVLIGPRGMGASGRFCVIRDPAGATVALHAR